MARSTIEPVTVKLLVLSAVPVGTVTLILPEVEFVGTVAVICVAEFTAKGALTPLNVTADAEVKFVPLMTMESLTAPLAGEKPVMTGGRPDLPSTLSRRAAAISDDRAVKNV